MEIKGKEAIIFARKRLNTGSLQSLPKMSAFRFNSKAYLWPSTLAVYLIKQPHHHHWARAQGQGFKSTELLKLRALTPTHFFSPVGSLGVFLNKHPLRISTSLLRVSSSSQLLFQGLIYSVRHLHFLCRKDYIEHPSIFLVKEPVQQERTMKKRFKFSFQGYICLKVSIILQLLKFRNCFQIYTPITRAGKVYHKIVTWQFFRAVET